MNTPEIIVESQPEVTAIRKTPSQAAREVAEKMTMEKASTRAASMALANSSWGKDMSEDQRAAVEKVARDLGLSIAAGHLIVLGGNPFITLEGRLVQAEGTGKFEGFDEGPLPKEEWEGWGIPPEAKSAWRVTVYRKGCPRPFNEVGWAGGPREERQPVARMFPGEMARKRGRARALKLAFPVGLPSAEEPFIQGEAIPEEILNKAMEDQPAPRGDFYERAQALGFSPAQANAEARGAFGKPGDALTRGQVTMLLNTLKSRAEEAIREARKTAAAPSEPAVAEEVPAI